MTDDTDNNNYPNGKFTSRQIGPYKLLEVLGEGGMAVVYLAEQSTPVRRRVALKMLKAGMDSKELLARFDSERQALAVLDHPGIAKIYDGGLADNGRPYFVMEYVKGTPITDYCDEHRLSNEERLQLFIDVCAGVQHAHLKGLIHRDLKPSNILVSVIDNKPRSKIIDFGIAKATATPLTDATLHTRIGQVIGTPAYMSPEQGNLQSIDIDTRTDVYSLGVILYELLVGTVPLDLPDTAANGMLHALREKDPPRPSIRFTTLGDTQTEIAKVRRTAPEELRRQLRGDLDWIVMRAIEKDRTRRYETANALAMECRRFLQHEPVLARPPSAAYLFSRFVRRNRLMTSAVAVAVVAVIGGVTSGTIGYIRAVDAEKIAVQEAATAREVSRFLVDLFAVSDPGEALGNTITAREILDKGAMRIEQDLANQPAVVVTLLEKIGSVYRGLGLYERSEELLLRSRDLAQQLYPESDPRVTSVDYALGHLYSDQSRFEEAAQLVTSVVERDTETFGRSNLRIAESLNLLASIYRNNDLFEEAEAAAVEGLALNSELFGEGSLEHARSLLTLAVVERELGKHVTSLDKSEQALALLEQHLPQNHPDLIAALLEISINLSEQGRIAEQEPYTLRMLDMSRTVYGEDHSQYAKALEIVAIYYAKQGKLKEAEPYFLEALAVSEVALGPLHDSLGFRFYNVGYFYLNMERYEEAEEYIRRSIGIWTELYGTDHSSNGWAWNALALIDASRERYSDAMQAADRGYAINEALYGEEHPNTSASMALQALVTWKQGRPEEAAQSYRKVIDIRTRLFGEDSPRVGELLEKYVEVLTELNRTREAESMEEWRARIEARQADNSGT